jgi:hypothetical protein
VIVAGGHDPVSDSGAESCGEEVRLRTAEVFMTGIQTAITANLEERGEVSGKPRLRWAKKERTEWSMLKIDKSEDRIEVTVSIQTGKESRGSRVRQVRREGSGEKVERDQVMCAN